jgi:hypothetical protein
MTAPSPLEAEAARLRALADQYDARAALDRAMREASTPAERSLAVAYHAAFCLEHPEGQPHSCPWYDRANAQDPELRDWGHPESERWLQSVVAGLQVAKAAGWTVEEP